MRSVVSTAILPPADPSKFPNKHIIYYHIKPAYANNTIHLHTFDYNSSQDILSKDRLKEVLTNCHLLDKEGEYEY